MPNLTTTTSTTSSLLSQRRSFSTLIFYLQSRTLLVRRQYTTMGQSFKPTRGQGQRNENAIPPRHSVCV